MAEGVDVPALGRVKKEYLYAGAALVVGIVGWAWWSRSRAESTTTTVDPTTGSEDPATGGAYVNPRPVQSVVDDSDDVLNTNVKWTQAVTQTLSTMFYDSTFIATTLGKYLARQPLTTDEADLVRTAWAFHGKPPDGPDSFTLTNTGGNATKPYVLYYLLGSNPPRWALAGGSEKWQEISGASQQGKANEWAAQHMTGHVAITLPNQATWDQYKADALK